MIAEPIEIGVINDAPAFAALGAEWNALLKVSATDGPFLTWEWLHAWWTHLAGWRRLRVVTARAGGRLIGVAPLAVSRHGLPWLSKLEFLGTGFAGSDYLDLIVDRRVEAEATRALAGALRAQNIALRLDHLPAGSTIAASVAAELAREGWTPLRSHSGECPFASLSNHTWDTYLKTLASSHQTRVRRCVNTLGKKFAVRFEAATTEAERSEALASLVAFHDARWGQRGGSTAFQTPALRAFHDDATRRALSAGWLRLYVLRLNGTPAAVTYCFAYNGRFYLYQHGFNGEYRQYSVGLVALALTIRAAIDEGALEFDMLYGCEPYKWLWARDRRALERLDLYPPDAAGRIHQRSVEAAQTMKLLVRRILSRRACNTNIPSAGVVS